ncbi:MAG: carboxypeptidase-like regulatory domain-containing protein, partial [Acidobacteriota bacterium]
MSSIRRTAMLSCVVLLTLVFVTAASAQTTGSVAGRVTDSDGGVLPGVTVEARSPNLQGTRTDVTNESGQFRFTLLPPGTYTLNFNLQGFGVESRDIAVSLDQDITLNVQLTPAPSEEITVTSEVPVVDTTSTTR